MHVATAIWSSAPRVLATLLAAVLATAGSSASNAAEDADLGKLLAAAVDLPTAAARREAADRLAARADVTLEAWLAAMKSFGTFEPVRRGSQTERTTLFVGDAKEDTSIAVYVPQSYEPGKPAPLIFALHGSGGEGHDEDGLWTAAAESLGALVVAPTDTSAAMGLKYGDDTRCRALAALRWARRRFDVDENRVFITGVSRGGHLTWDVALRNPDLFAAMAPMIGGPRLTTAEGQNNLRYLENVARLPIRDLQGADDDPNLLANLRMAFRKLEAFGAKQAQFIEFPGIGHDFDPKAGDWTAFLGASRREPVPVTVVRCCARLDEARAFWAEVTRVPGAVEEKFRLEVDPDKWKAMDEREKREWTQDEAQMRTARLEVKLEGPGRFTAKTTRVQRFRLLLTREMFDPAAPVSVTTNGKLTRHDVKPAKLVLLREFAERFDRTFLPVADLSCP